MEQLQKRFKGTDLLVYKSRYSVGPACYTVSANGAYIVRTKHSEAVDLILQIEPAA